MHTSICNKCGIKKSVEDFHRNKTRSDGVSSVCRICQKEYYREYYKKNSEKRKTQSKQHYQANPEKHRIKSKEWQRNNPEVKRSHLLKYRYGITQEQYNKRLENQNHSCAICGTANSGKYRFRVDHSHTTGEVRGLLCGRCNVKLGVLEDIEFLEKATKYLEDSKL